MLTAIADTLPSTAEKDVMNGTITPNASASADKLTPVRILDENGMLVGEPPQIEPERLRAMLRLMMLGRRLDQKAISLQRRGKLGTYPPLSGQEAAAVGTAYAMDAEVDHFVPQYREQLTMLHWGLPLSTYLLQRMGHPAGSALPSHGRLWPQQVALGAHLPHAVGLAWGMRLQGKPGVVLTQFGDGASNEGDFHEACNIAGVKRAPLVMVCQNNGWAISIPWHEQSAAESVALRAAGYGFPGIAVDGNDVLAVYSAVADARTRAEAGDGPTLIEARCHRLGAHSTADDPKRYRPADFDDQAAKVDPIHRFRAYLVGLGQWDDTADTDTIAWCDDQIVTAVAEFDATPPPDPGQMLQHLYAEPDMRLRRQQEELRSSIEENR